MSASNVTKRPNSVRAAFGYGIYNPYLMGTTTPNPGASGGGTTYPTAPGGVPMAGA